jgi:hypothetical protein
MVKEALHEYRNVCFDSDAIAGKIWLSLLSDFQQLCGKTFAAKALEAMRGGISTFREYHFPELGVVPPLRFKCYKQLEHLFKKYRFKKDRYTDEELFHKTYQAFIGEQISFSNKKPISALADLVLKKARVLSREILGKYDPEATIGLSKFGKKSSIGCPLNLAYIDQKLTDVGAFTGSSECSKWFFNDVLPKDHILLELVKKLGFTLNTESPQLEHDSLNLVLVPKSWKTYRPITPLTLLGLFFSYGVGEQITNCLKSIGLDLSTLQRRHAKLVKLNSRTRKSSLIGGKLVTADLVSASQSLTSDLLNRTLPREWYSAMKKTFSRQLCVRMPDGSVSQIYTESILPMGNGLTFPTETLVFYVILKAIAELAGVTGFISVYGDDLIYPRRLHKFVAVIFPQLGFKLNLDKTFVEAPFRESCGSDFYRGHDVRPSMLPEGCHDFSSVQYASFLYKCINSLCRRWDPIEIPKTYALLVKELDRLQYPVFRVPPSFPDTAGIRVENLAFTPPDLLKCTLSPVRIFLFRWDETVQLFLPFIFSYTERREERYALLLACAPRFKRRHSR